MNTGFRNAPIGRKMTLVAGGAAAFGLLLAAAALIGLAYRDQLENSRHEPVPYKHPTQTTICRRALHSCT